MVLEVSGNYSIILPVLIANTFAYLISRSLQPVAIFDVLTRQDGVELPSMEEQREEGTLRVEDAMRPATRAALDTVLNANDTVEQVFQRWGAKLPDVRDDIRLVRLNPIGWSSVSRQALEVMVKEGKGNITLGSALTGQQIPFLHPDNPLETALRYVDRWPLLPVVSRADFRKLEGVISQQDVLKRYQLFGEEENGEA